MGAADTGRHIPRAGGSHVRLRHQPRDGQGHAGRAALHRDTVGHRLRAVCGRHIRRPSRQSGRAARAAVCGAVCRVGDRGPVRGPHHRLHRGAVYAGRHLQLLRARVAHENGGAGGLDGAVSAFHAVSRAAVQKGRAQGDGGAGLGKRAVLLHRVLQLRVAGSGVPVHRPAGMGTAVSGGCNCIYGGAAKGWDFRGCRNQGALTRGHIRYSKGLGEPLFYAKMDGLEMRVVVGNYVLYCRILDYYDIILLTN